MAKALINRARELAEDLKVHRVPSADHVVIALLIEPMQNRESLRSGSSCQCVLTNRVGMIENPEEGNGTCGSVCARPAKD